MRGEIVARIDKQNRVVIPETLCEIATSKITDKVFIHEKDDAFLLCDVNCPSIPCLGSGTVDEKRRFYIPKDVRNLYKITSKTDLKFYVLNGDLFLKIV